MTALTIVRNIFKRFLPLIIVFLEGVAGMAIEILAVRIVSPFLGASTEVWSIIICIIMLALSLGYFLGSRFKSVYFLLFLAGIFIVISYIFVNYLASLTGFTAGIIQLPSFFRIFLISSLLFFLPVFLLGSTYPLLIPIADKIFGREMSGSIFAISTIGSIIGTLLATFILIPFFGAKISFLAVAILLELTAIFGFSRWIKVLPMAALIFTFWIYPKQSITSSKTVIFQTESIYQTIRVIKAGQSFYLSLDGRGLDQGFSSVYNPNKYLTEAYFDNFLLLPYSLPKISPLNVLIVGLGGGTISRQYQHYFGPITNLKMDGVEIDPEVVETAKKYFDLDQPGLKIHTEDGRIFLSQSKDKYNLILVDVYAHQTFIPYYFATKEFIKVASDHLDDGGLMAYNVSDGSFDKTRLKYVSQTLVTVFPYTYIIYPDEGTEYLVVGSKAPTDFIKNLPQGVSSDITNLYRKFKGYSITKVSTGDTKFILTDDKSPEKI